MFCNFTFLHECSLYRASMTTIVCYSWALKRVLTLFLQLHPRCRRLLLQYMTPDIIFFVFLSPVVCFVTHLLRVKHPNILQLVDVFETKKEYFLFLELWVQMSDEPGGKALCLSLRSLGPAELYVLIIHSWEWAVIAWGLVDMRTALNSTHLVFRYDCLLAAPFSSACVLGEFDTFPWIC